MSRIVDVKNVCLKFPQSKTILFSNLSISINHGEKVLILGPSGCGKSTLLKILSGLIPQSIEVPMKAEELIIPHSRGYIFQSPDDQFCMPYVDEEIAFSLENLQVPRDEMPARIQELLVSADLSLSNPHTDIRHLSGGMKQRLAIASVLALDPKILFLDEPTAMLDPQGTKEVWETIKKVAVDKTLVIVEHKLNYVLEVIDRIILLNAKGVIIADGMRDNILKEYHREIKKSGIWYPDAWKEYLEINSIKFQRGVLPLPNNERITLRNFKGYLQREIKIEVPQVTVQSGEWIAILGENGAGKSTLLCALMQLIQTSGNYLLMGLEVNNITKVTNHCGFVFQNPEYQFLTNSVYDELAYSLRLDCLTEEKIQERVEEFLHIFLLKEQVEKHPYQLSMGQKRRLSVATALLKKIPIVILDEPTFGLDARNTFRMLELLENYRKEGITILMSTHDQFIVKYVATRVWRIDKGKLTHDTQQINGADS